MNVKKTSLILLSLVATHLLLSNTLLANPKNGDRKGPPKEAIEACADKNEGERVTFTTPHGHEVTGTCVLMKEVMVAMPEDRPKREQ